jgi:hypothetical protein
MQSVERPTSSLRTGIVAFFAGLAITVVPSVAVDALMHATGVFPSAGSAMSTSRWAFAAAYRAVFAVLGLYVTARLATSRAERLVWALAALGVLAGGLGYLATRGRGPGFGPDWYGPLIALLPLPCAMAALWLSRRAS